jgi:GAF domain-containing protein
MAFLGFDDTQNERIWSDDEVNILQTLARNIASSIERIANETAINESEENSLTCQQYSRYCLFV